MSNLLNSSLINIIISLAFIYALLSILVSSLLEGWNSFNNARGRRLHNAISEMLKDPFNLDYGTFFFDHFMIRGLSHDLKKPTPYIPSGLFADALIDILANQALRSRPIRQLKSIEDGKTAANDLLKGKQFVMSDDSFPADLKGRLELSWTLMKDSPFKDVMESFWLKSGGDVAQFKRALEDWFNDHMDRVSGWYKYKTRMQSIFFGFSVAIVLNIDSLHLVKVLSMDTTLRNNLVASAENVSDTYMAQLKGNAKELSIIYKSLPPALRNKTTDELKKELEGHVKKDSVDEHILSIIKKDSVFMSQADSVLGITTSLNIPIGWSHNSPPVSWFGKGQPCNEPYSHSLKHYTTYRNSCRSVSNVFLYLLGVTISGLSLSLGAPFWFDMLLKFVNIRRTGKRPESTKPSEP